MIRTRLASCLCSAILMLTLLGCAQNGPSGSAYLLDAARVGEPVPRRADAILEVRRFGIGAEFAGRGLVYRTSDFEFETDSYREFLIAPSQLVTERTREWLARSGLFEQVLVQGSRLRPTHVLEGNVLGLYGDFRNPTSPAAILEMRCFLIATEGATQEVVFAREYTSVMPLAGDNAESFIRALDECLVDVLTTLEADLARSVLQAAL